MHRRLSPLVLSLLLAACADTPQPAASSGERAAKPAATSAAARPGGAGPVAAPAPLSTIEIAPAAREAQTEPADAGPAGPGATEAIGAAREDAAADMPGVALVDPGEPPTLMPADAPREPPATTGSIAGRLSFPGEALPAMRVCAFPGTPGTAASAGPTCVLTVERQAEYRIDGLPPGDYHVLSWAQGGERVVSAWSVCARDRQSSCINGELEPVRVRVGETSAGVDPADSDNEEDSWPREPVGLPPQPLAAPPLVPELGVSIAGSIALNAEVPPARVCAIAVDASVYACALTAAGVMPTFRIEGLPPGRYELMAWLDAGEAPVGRRGDEVMCIRTPCPPPRFTAIELAAGDRHEGAQINIFRPRGEPGWPQEPAGE